MDPNRTPPSRPPQRTPYISDFTPPRSAGTANGGQSQSDPQPQPPTAPTLNRGSTAPQPAARPIQQPQPRPITSASRPSQPASTQPLPGAAHPPVPPASRKSFSIEEPEAISPGISDRPVKPNQGLRDILSILGVLASAMLLAFALITFVFQSYQVDGPSMQTTLENNDHLIVWKVPKTVAKMTGQHYIPHRGDVVIFNEPTSAIGQDKQLIKRVIGLPGERVTVKNGFPAVYNKEHPEGFNPDKELPYGKVITTTNGNVDVTVKENEVFVMGDNRTNSLDSRIFGPVSSDQLVGKLVLRVLPLNSVTKF